MSEKKHSKLSPSASHRWIKCPGSIKLSDSFPTPASADYAIEGTAAHELGEYCLKHFVPAINMRGAFINVEENGVKTPVEVTNDMCIAVQEYVDFVNSLASKDQITEGSKLRFVEERFDLSWLIPNTGGSNDSCVYDPSTQTLHVIDYKHGAGVAVDPEWNSQLMMYALGAMYSIWRKYIADSGKNFSMTNIVKNLYLHIVQPRSYQNSGIKSWNIDSVSVLAWGVEVLQRAARVTEQENAPLEIGEHCRFCPCLAMCPKMVEQSLAVAKTDFNNPVLPSPQDMTALDISKVMDIVDVFSSWSKEVKNYAIAQLANGNNIPGYKLVKGRSSRSWTNPAQTKQVLEPLLKEHLFTSPEIISPAQAEKVIKALGYEIKIDNLINKSEGAPTIAKESDKRKEQKPTAEIDFAEVI